MTSSKLTKVNNNTILLLIFIPLLIGVLFEVVILGIAFFGADEVDCNLLWCEFKTLKNSECYQNGIKINCSEIPNVNSIINNAMGDINER